MEGNLLIGRHREQEELKRRMTSDRSELVIVYGRRRVGKTYLIDSFFDGRYDFTYVGGHHLTQRQQLNKFSKALKKAMGEKTMRPLTDWFDAFDVLEEYLESLPKERKKVVFIDEMPWIDSQKSTFVSAFETFWNGWAARRRDIVFIASGSATSWMADKLIDNPGGLHARITCHLYLRPFTLAETEEYLQSKGCKWDRYQIAQCYMTFGGIPFYLSLIDPQRSLVENIDLLCFNRGGALRAEFDELYTALFTNADNYIAVAKLLASHRGGMTYSDIEKSTGIEGGRLTKVLGNLEKCDFVMKFKYYGKKEKDRIYKLCDFFTLFYYKFMEPNADSYDEQWWSHHFQTPSATAWHGLTFELLCLMHIPQIKKALGIEGVATDVSAWYDTGNRQDSGERGAQIDLVIERSDRIIHLCEMKFSSTRYRIKPEYEEKLRYRTALFRDKTKTTKATVNTFITTYGIENPEASSIVNSEVKLDDLF